MYTLYNLMIIPCSYADGNAKTPRIEMAIFVTQYVIPAFTIGFAAVYFLVGVFFVYMNPNIDD